MSNKPLQFAKDVTNQANKVWESGEFLQKVTPTTAKLLSFWFDDKYVDNRDGNFHEGQRQSILNTIYIHEILKSPNIKEAYLYIAPDIMIDSETGISELSKDKYSHPKYCIKMATGTGKTWVLSALLIWQYLNAKYEKGK